ncbi:hypothetical protein J2S04_001485 [Alicyclobacillus tengchongensis]|uniref:Uncharacterized protein n=1 Tax=Alicyclobacillus tolerans TaxID=90970 RepID=A0ABT9LW91_9BACL|nr:hypothetical protein [Alicyclobacillus tengchongensis]
MLLNFQSANRKHNHSNKREPEALSGCRENLDSHSLCLVYSKYMYLCFNIHNQCLVVMTCTSQKTVVSWSSNLYLLKSLSLRTIFFGRLIVTSIFVHSREEPSLLLRRQRTTCGGSGCTLQNDLSGVPLRHTI